MAYAHRYNLRSDGSDGLEEEFNVFFFESDEGIGCRLGGPGQ